MLKTKLLPLILILLTVIMIGRCTTYTSQYPTHDADHVKATSAEVRGEPYFATNPALSLTGTWINNCWMSDPSTTITNQRFHIDLGSPKVIKRIYYENWHHSGSAAVTRGVQNFTFWGSNTGVGTFDDLVWGNDDGWTILTVATNVMLKHIEADQADPQYIVVTNSTSYQYYAFKFVDNYGDANYIGIRRIELQTEDVAVEAVNIMFLFSDF